MSINRSNKIVPSLLLVCSLAITPSIANAQTDAFETLFRDQEYTILITKLEDIGESNFDQEQYRLYVYSLSNRDLDDAEEAAERAIIKFDKDPDMFLMHASIMGSQAQNSIFSALGYADKALSSLNNAVTIAPNEPQYLAALMTFYIAAPSIAGGDMDKALALANKIATIDALEGAKAKARYHLSNDEAQQALIELNKAAEAYPENIALYSQIAGVHSSLEDYDQAITHYEKATLVGILPLTLGDGGLETDKHDEDEANKRESDLFRVLNSHYQIGRTALISESHTDKGISHLNTYLDKYKNTDIDVSGLPTAGWARLRLAGLMVINEDHQLARETIGLVKLEDDSSMKKIHKKLVKRIKNALK